MSWVASRKVQGLKKRLQYCAFSSAGLLGLGGASPSNTGTYGRNLLLMIQLFRSLSVKPASLWSKVYPAWVQRMLTNRDTRKGKNADE